MITTFGYTKRQPPTADKVVDVRDQSHNPHSWDEVVDRIVDGYRPGQSIAIGCEKGRHRSVEIGKRVAERLKIQIQHYDGQSDPKPVLKMKKGKLF